MKNSCWSVLLLLIFSGSTFASEKMTCKVVTNWNDGFGNYHYREVCDFSNGDRTVTDCTAYGCDVERTTAAERKNENTTSEAAAQNLLQTMPLPEVVPDPPKVEKKPSPVKVIEKEHPQKSASEKAATKKK
jgi:hypothetical protein